MARKVNPMLAGIEARHRRELIVYRKTTIRQCADMMLIAANYAFGLGADRLDKLQRAFFECFDEYLALSQADAKDDKHLEYTKAKLDQKLAEIMGPHFRPWADRYGTD